jgi:hypothetical protein
MKAIFTVFCFLMTTFVFANNIQLQKVSLSDTNRAAKTVNIKMNISWEHSWRDSINWDAAWIIIKYKEPKDNLWKWKHAQLSLAGNSTGTAAGVKIVVPDDRTGAFFYRSEAGIGMIASDNVKLLWNYGAAGVVNIDSVEVRVFATEMVYIPQGNYCLGDGNGASRSDNSFQLKNSPNNYAVINDKWSALINTYNPNYVFSAPDDAVVNASGIRISGLNGIDINNDKVAEFPNYPTGYRIFYCMKYKITQGQYTDFLNTVCANDTTLTAIENYLKQPNQYFTYGKLQGIPKQLLAVWVRLADYLTWAPADVQRYSIALDSVQAKFTVSRPDRAYDVMDMNRGLSFSEWFGLRPMSELEFEKTNRGPLPAVFNERSWGQDSQIPVAFVGGFVNLKLSGIENGTEVFSDYDITKRNYLPFNPRSVGVFTVTGGDNGVGPYRVGIYANDTSSRVSSGAGYYGVMDMRKISGEYVLPLSTVENRSFNYNMNGKGVLSALGNNYSFSTAFGPSFSSTIFKNYFVSKRGNINPTLGNYGFRAVRVAPTDN